MIVPAGWDTWGKIRVQRERFDPEGFGQGWEVDLEQGQENKAGGALKAYEDVVIDLDGTGQVSSLRAIGFLCPDSLLDLQPNNSTSSRVEAQDEQTFLKAHYEVLQKDTKDPRAAFAVKAGSNNDGYSTGMATSVVGPMASAGLSLPVTERDPEDVTARLAKMVRKVSRPG